MQLMNKIIKDDKNLIISFCLLFLCVFLTYKVPHRPMVFVELLIPTLHISTLTIYLGTTLLIVPFVYAITGILNSTRFRKRNKLFLFFAIIFLLLPLMHWSIDFTRTTFNWLFHQELKALDIKDSNIYISQNDNEITVNVEATLIDYSRSQKQFHLRIQLPEEIASQIGTSVLESDNMYYSHGHKSETQINETFHIPMSKAILPSTFLSDKNYIFQLYNDEETVEIITHR